MERSVFVVVMIVAMLVLGACHKSASAEERRAESESLYQTGYTLMIERRYKTACDTFEKAIALDKTNAQAWYDVSFCLIELGKYGKAVDAARRAAELYQNATMYDDKIAFRNDALVQAGEAYLWNKKIKQAAAQFQAVYDLDPANYDTLLNIVTTYIRCERVEEALQFCEKNIRAHSDEPAVLAPLYLLYANCQYALGKEDESFWSLQVAQENALKANTTAYDDAISALYAQIAGETEADKSHQN